jgi:Cytochrome P460
MMKTGSKVIVAAGVVAITGLMAGVEVRAGRDRVAFPENYAKGVRYLTLDMTDTRDVRDYYASPEAAEAAKKGEPLPDGTVITVVIYAAQLDADGKPVKDANGRLVKTDKILGYTAMEKHAGWGNAYPEVLRNGDWEYQVFLANKTPNMQANMTSCFKCHMPQAANDFVFTYDSLKIAR